MGQRHVSGNALRPALRHLVTVQRDLSLGTDDGWGNANAPDWHDHVVDLPCFAWTTTGHETADVVSDVEVESLKMIVPLGTDVNQQDRLGDITERDVVVVKGPISIRSVFAQQDHLELRLVRLA